MVLTLTGGRTPDLTIDEHLTVDPAIADLHAKYSVDGDPVTLTSLILQAHWAGQPLCSAARCWTPHDLELRSCCDDFVCAEHTEDHDDACRPFLAILREDTL